MYGTVKTDLAKEYLLQPFDETDIKTRYHAFAEQQKQIDDTIIDLITQYADRQDLDGGIETFRTLINKRRKFSTNTTPEHLQLPDHLETYNDHVARHILEKVIVLDAVHLLVTFKGGVSVEQIL